MASEVDECPEVPVLVNKESISNDITMDKVEEEAACSQPVSVNPASSVGEMDLPVVLTHHKYNTRYKYFVCQVPQQPEKCYKFRLTSSTKLPDGTVQFSSVCSRCRHVASRRRGSDSKEFEYTVRTTATLQLFISSPALNHRTDCEPEDYANTVKCYPALPDCFRIQILQGLLAISAPIASPFPRPFNRRPPTTNTALAADVEELPVEVTISRTFHHCQFFVCKLPQSDSGESQKCVRFRVVSSEKLADGKMEFSIACPCRYKPSISYEWKSDGLTVSRPLDNHLHTKCRPLVYDDVIKDRIRYEVKEKILRGKSIEMHLSPFGSPHVLLSDGEAVKTDREEGLKAATPSELPVILAANRKHPEQLSLICRLPVNPEKCIQFEIVDSEMLADGSVEFTVECSKCAKVYGGIPDFHPKRKSNGLVLVTPLDNHLPRCKYWIYQATLKRNPMVFDQVKEKILKGQAIDMHLPPQAFPFPISEEFRRAYEKKEGRQLLQIGDRARDMEKERDESRKGKDGEVEAGQQDSLNRREKPKYPVEISRGGDGKDSSPEWRPFFIYRLENRPGKCYRFVVKNYRKDANGVTFSVQCVGCQSVFLDIVKGIRPFLNVTVPVKTTDGLSMRDDPLIGHIENCVPFDYNETIRSCLLVTNEFKKHILSGNYVAINGRVPAPKKKYGQSPLFAAGHAPLFSAVTGLLNKNNIGGNTVDRESCSRKRKATWDEPTTVTYRNQKPDSTVSEFRGSGSLVIAESSQSSVISTVPSNAAPKPTEPRQLHGISVLSLLSPFGGATSAVKEEVDDEIIDIFPPTVSSPLSIPSPSGNPLVSIPASVRRFQLAVPKKFEKKFDANNFTEDDVDISVDRNVLRVMFERKSSIGPSRSSHNLLYEYDLPDYVIVDTIFTSLANGQLVVTANTTST